MRLLKPSRSESPQRELYQVVRGPEDEYVDETRHIKILVDAWLKSLDESRPKSRAACRIERELYDSIKASPLYGKILSFAGLNIWVDERTPDGVVVVQESINL
jgi:hypothetical protein